LVFDLIPGFFNKAKRIGFYFEDFDEFIELEHESSGGLEIVLKGFGDELFAFK
jgi:hypothetical protein